MSRIDLRQEVPPLGFNAAGVPLVDVDFTTLDLERYRLPNPHHPDSPIDVFTHPRSVGLVIRRHSVDLEDASTRDELESYLRYAEAEHTRFADTGVPVIAVRHLDARLPTADPDVEGELFSLSPRLLFGYEHLDPRREDHIASSLFVLRGLTLYTKNALADASTERPRFLRDIFHAHQFSTIGSEVNLLPILHDVDPILEDVRSEEGDPSLSLRAAVGELKEFAEEVMATAYNTPDEHSAYKVLREIQTELPKPYYFG
jgi:hypothetical protein